MPAELLDAIAHAGMILSWQENLTSDDMPPVWMWSLVEELNEYFDDLAVRRRSQGGADDDDDEPAGGMVRNQYAKGRGRA